MPRISSANTEPMCANWRRCSARPSAFAPESIRTDGPLLAGRAERLDLAAAVRLAGRAHLVRRRRLVAVRAETQPRRRNAVLGAALVAARLRRFSLGNCHQRPRSIAMPRARPLWPRGTANRV